MFDSKHFNSAMGTVIKLVKDTLTCFSAMTAILMSMCTNHIIHVDIKIAVVACAIWKMEGLAEKQVRVSLTSFMTAPMHGRVETFTVKHYVEMGEHNIFYFKMEYIVLFGTPISQKCLTCTVNFLLLCHAW